MGATYYRIEVVCELLELPRAQLRRYERIGLVAPSRAPDDRAPHYSEDDVRRIRRLRRMQRDLGLNMAGLQVAARLLDQIEALQRQLNERRSPQ